MRFPDNIEKLIDYFSKLPGIGPKTAERFVYYLLKQPKQFSFGMAQSITNLANSITHCDKCHSISETNPCLLCVDSRRDVSQLCVVAETHDVTAIEDTGHYKGYYHVLNGVLDPVHGVTPDQLTLDSLMVKLQSNGNIKEVILALNPDIEGESSMMFIKKLLNTLNVKVTRLAQGLPTGSDLEYADASTLSKALSNRTGM